MKKILSGILCLAMVLSMSVTAFAADISTDGGSQNVTVTYGMSEGFTVTIPTNFTIDDSAKATAKVSASNVVIAHGSTLKVAISGDDYVDSWELVDEAEADNTLTYTIGTTEGGNDIVNGSTVLSVEAGTTYNDTVEETMYFTVTDTLSKAGTYKDTLTFTVSVEDAVTITAGEYSLKSNADLASIPNGRINVTFEHENGLGTYSGLIYDSEDDSVYSILDDMSFTIEVGQSIFIADVSGLNAEEVKWIADNMQFISTL